MTEPKPDETRALRLVIIDDNPFVRTPEGIRPRSATFHRFAEAVAEVGPFSAVDYCIPVADLKPGEQAPPLAPVEQRHLNVVATAPFPGIAGYLLRLPIIWSRNSRTFDAVIREADLVWIKAPASNALLVARACARWNVPRFTYVAGSVGAVIAAQHRSGPNAAAARLVARLYDAVTRWLMRTGPALVLDSEFFSSVVDEADAAETDPDMPEHQPGAPWRIAWAGRLAGEKRLGDLLGAVASLRVRGRPIELLIVGDGPERRALENRAERLGLSEAIEWTGYVGDPSEYVNRLRSADMFVLPSRAEGVPKVLVEAMAAGLPVIATRSGAVADVCGDGSRGLLVEPGDVDGLARAIILTMDDARGRAARRSRALLWAWEHTRRAQARRLVRWIESQFPSLVRGPASPTAAGPGGQLLPGMLETRDSP